MRFLILMPLLFLTGCAYFFFGAGTLGGFDLRNFPTNKMILVAAIDSLYKSHPEYKIPEKWKNFDDWSKRGYDFLDSRIFYLKSDPEELYYVTFIGDAAIQANPSQIGIAVRAIHQGNSSWTLEKDCNHFKKRRIEKRFDSEIISKLEVYTKTKAIRE